MTTGMPDVTPRYEEVNPPTPPFVEINRERDPLLLPRSRPLSEISDNSDQRRSFLRSVSSKSRPASEVGEDGPSGKTRVPSSGVGEIRTITLNLNDYTSNLKSPSSPAGTSTTSPPASAGLTGKVGVNKPSLPPRTVSAAKDRRWDDEAIASGSGSSEDSRVSEMLVNKRQSLRPSPLSASYADITKPALSPSSSSFESARSTPDVPQKPPTKAKPSWLRRASGTAALRSKSRSPLPNEDTTTLPTPAQPPSLPPRKTRVTDVSAPMGPPAVPRRSSYANVAASGPSRNQADETETQPALAPAPPPLPSREHVGNIRHRLTAWTQAAQSSSSFSRSESSNSLASTSAPSAFGVSTQRLPASAQRVFGHAGSAVQKGWAGLRSRGVGGSISSMSALGAAPRKGNMESSGSWSSGLVSGGPRERMFEEKSRQAPTYGDGPVFLEGVVKRPGDRRQGRVFGRELRDVAKAWGVEGAHEAVDGLSDYEKKRRASLPAVVLRTVEYLEIWGPKEEGIFRISGRTSHLSRLRKEFDSGADLDLRECHPADLDPHAVAGIFKTYLRELPSPLLTNELTPRFDAYVRNKANTTNEEDKEDELAALLHQLPDSHWFLLADIVKLLVLIPQHANVNRMTLKALMLSLGPSLNISGGVINELLARRDVLFSKPPPSFDKTIALIDFGDVEIDPPTIPQQPTTDQARSATPLSHRSEASSNSQPSNGEMGPKKKPTLPKKPSMSGLFGRATSRTTSMETLSRPASVAGTLPHRTDGSPPRVDVTIAQTSPLPLFEETIPQSSLPSVTAKPPLEEQSLQASEPAWRSRLSWTEVTVPTTPTPIADRFSSVGSSFPSLSGPQASITRSGSGSLTNPAAVRRRGGGAPVFFSSSQSIGGDRNLRSRSTDPGATLASMARGKEGTEEKGGNDLAAQGGERLSNDSAELGGS